MNIGTENMKLANIMMAGALILSTLFATGGAQAATVTVTANGTNYNLTTDFISYSGNVALLQGQAWW